jgi:hypothetical protein
VAVRVVAAVLSAPRDRLGRLVMTATDKDRANREALRVLAVQLKVPGCHDILDQCAKVLAASVQL